MYKPSATYRIQFHKDFNFKSLDQIIPYLKKLGIDTIYASPIFEAVPGSTHGYDLVNPHIINPEIGTEAELFALSAKLKKAGIKWLQDIVPNHMAYHPNNKWLMDVLKNGKSSKFASFFDVNFGTNQKLMVPFLGVDLDEAIEEGSLQLAAIDGQFFLSYGGSNWPINETAKEKLLDRKIEDINADVQLVKEVANEQYYRLCNWKETNHAINYRRFFTVNSLICLNIQHQQTFDVYHEYIFNLVEKGIFQGLRIDHIDGLYDPKGYLDRLRHAVGKEIYIVVEKILESDEQMPQNWNAQGSTGYDFLAIINNLFTNKAAKNAFNKLYKKVTGKNLDPEKLIHQKKTAILYDHMQGELDNLVRLFNDLKLIPKKNRADIDPQALKLAIGDMMIQMPVYRYYNYSFPLKGTALDDVKALLQNQSNQTHAKAGNKLLWHVFIENPALEDDDYRLRVSQFFQRCMQFTGPLMAKGVEDTLMFTYNRFAGHTEVGDAPDAFGLTVEQFHHKMLERQQLWPLSLNGSATHDTKKGEDIRARLNVLSDIPKEWEQVVEKLMALTARLKEKDKSFSWLHSNDVYLIIQTILGALAMPGEAEDDLHDRLEQYIEKALREAKKRSNWAEPNEEYEFVVKDFANELLKPESKSYQTIQAFSQRIADFGIVNSLAQVLLKFTCPGIPDVYQGTELWDLSLVDPDNRRAVDYVKRAKYLNEIKNESSLNTIWDERYAGKTKLWLTQLLFTIRKKYAEVFEKGTYIPLEVKGTYAPHICAYIRKFNNQYIMVAVPLGMATLMKNENLTEFDWQDTTIILPEKAPTAWQNLISGKEGVKDFLSDGILIQNIFSVIPLGLLTLKSPDHHRSAGILMHITSLPSDYGIGDFGSQAFKFIDFLTSAGQKYWQILPLNPTKASNSYSPYSSNSAMAGNHLLISPEELNKDGLLLDEDLAACKLKFADQVDFAKAEKVKAKLLSKAYNNFLQQTNAVLSQDFEVFCKEENAWLNDFANYTVIKNRHQNLEWYNWPNELKMRDEAALTDFESQNAAEIAEIKWQQFIFYKQWLQLKKYANQNNVKIIGDLPFYVDRDAVEVWAHPEYFSLDEELHVLKIAGVPPDYFNKNGQLWGMPIFNWENLKTNRYDWWINRLKKNLDLFDLLRLDHFRAFCSYWEVPAGDKDAINGKWTPGPGADFFDEVKKQLGKLPFIAEDLGEITKDVEELRDQFRLPGMKVLQFAFGEDMISSPHIPYRYNTSNAVVYSGTHDNNTILGWFNTEINEQTKKRLSLYNGKKVTAKNILEVIIRLVYSANTSIAILPIQDVLGLGENTRMNVPGNANGNWTWRMDKHSLKPKMAKYLMLQAEIYGRNG